jgi:MYXO-CTERM domain-containing protein
MISAQQHSNRLSNYSRTAFATLVPAAVLTSGASADVWFETGLTNILSSTSGSFNINLLDASFSSGPVRTLDFSFDDSYFSINGQDLGWVGLNQLTTPLANWFGGLPVAEGASWNNLGRNASDFSGTNNTISYSASFGDINFGRSSSGGFGDDPQNVGDSGQTWYLLFKMTGSDDNSGNYGWLSFEAYVDGTTNSYMNVTGWAFDDTGATIEAGSIGDPVPGPGGLAALALGAYGLRSRRRQATTS